MDAVLFDPALRNQARARGAGIGLKKPLFLVAGLLLAVAAGVWAHHWLTVGRYIETTDDAYVGGDVTAIAPHVAGFVSAIAVSDNQFVRRGQLLLRLDDRDFGAAEDHAAAVVAGKRAELADLEAKFTLQRSTIRQSGADLASKEAAANFAHADDTRYQNLLRVLATSQQAMQKALTADQQARSDVTAAGAALAGARQQLAVLAADIDEARADLAQAEDDLRTAQLNLGYTEIRSPIDGYVGNRAIRVGAYVTVGSYLVSIIPAHGLWVDANFKEDQLAGMRPGEDATIVADVLPGREFHGRVMSLAPGTGSVFSVIPPENATGNFTKIVQRVPVRIVLDTSDATLGELRPGLSITASVDTRSGPSQ
ncbi:MAG TPA: HlyD family secretion protein [Rhizomicrobium sp.]|jgi:membrane fusion protein (multidrug efflux system)|nr:HlyD family secretion protein [Rhizomicrobium sp.]